MMLSTAVFWIAAVGLAVHLSIAGSRGDLKQRLADSVPAVVLPAPIQTLLYAGDRFLAANAESVRASASGVFDLRELGGFRLRSHRVVSQLNPCHEDNYWIGNAAMTWGGAVDDGLELLKRATNCRFWDEVPPFLYGFNLNFFRKDTVGARAAIEEAASRSAVNATGYRNIAIMLTVNAEKSAERALFMIRNEAEQATDQKLRTMLQKRAERLEGLVKLRAAQKTYETRFGVPLRDANDLMTSGVLDSFPVDPLRIGYVFRDGQFELARLSIMGLN